MKLRKKMMIVGTVFTLTLSGLGVVGSVSAEQTIDEKKENLSQNLNKVEKDILNATMKVNEINLDMSSLESALLANEEEVVRLTKEAKKHGKEIKQLKEEIKILEEEIKARHEILKERLSSYQNSGGDLGFRDVIFGSTGFEEFITRFTAVITITNADNKLIEEQKAAIKKVEKKEQQVQKKLKATEKAKAELTAINKEQKAQRKELNKSRKAVESEISNLENKKQAYIDEGNDLEALEEQIQIELNEREMRENENISINDVDPVNNETNEVQSEDVVSEPNDINSNNVNSEESNDNTAESSEDTNLTSQSRSVDTSTNTVENDTINSTHSNSNSNNSNTSNANESSSNSSDSSNSNTSSSDSSNSRASSSNSSNSSASSSNSSNSSTSSSNTNISSNNSNNSSSTDNKPKPNTSSKLGNGIIADAQALKGTRYKSVGSTPSGFDCSGYTSYVYAKNGINLPRTASQQYHAYPKVSKSQLRAGDLVFFTSSPGGKSITHVGISLGGSKYIGSQTSTGVAITSIDDPYYWGPRYVGAVRPN